MLPVEMLSQIEEWNNGKKRGKHGPERTPWADAPAQFVPDCFYDALGGGFPGPFRVQCDSELAGCHDL